MVKENEESNDSFIDGLEIQVRKSNILLRTKSV